MTQRILLGKFPAGDNSPNGYGLRISKAGYDVNTPNPNNEQLIFNSDWPTVLPIYTTGQTSVNAGGTATVNFPQDLGYIPFASAFVNVSGRGWEKYSCANVCYRLIQKKQRKEYCQTPGSNGSQGCQSTVSAKDLLFNSNPLDIYIFEGDRANRLQLNVFNNRLTFHSSSENASLYYIIYRMKAF